MVGNIGKAPDFSSFRPTGSRPSHHKHAVFRRFWWNPDRDVKLLYVMERYNDTEKACRVLGLPYRQRGAIFLRLKTLRYWRDDLSQEHQERLERLLEELRARPVGEGGK